MENLQQPEHNHQNVEHSAWEREPAADSPEDPAQRKPSPSNEASATFTAAQVTATALFEVSASLISILNPDELLENLLPKTVDALPSVQAGILWLYNQRVGRLRAFSAYGLPLDQETAAMLTGVSLKTGESLAGLALQQRCALARETHQGYMSIAGRMNPANQEIFQLLHDQLPHQISVACIPLQTGKEISGTLELLNLNQHQSDAPGSSLHDDIPMLEIYGSLVAAAIKKAQAYAQSENHHQRLKAFDAVVTAISTATDLRDMTHSVLNVILDLLSIPAGALLLLDPSQSRLTMQAYDRLPPTYTQQMTSILIADSICEEVVRYGQPSLRPLMEDRGEKALLEAGLTGCAYLPLLAGGTVVGVMALFDYDAAIHQRVDSATLMPICNQIGFAIANIRLYEDSQIERRKLSAVISGIAEGVVVCDRQGQLVLANEAAMELLSLESVPYQQSLSEMTDFYSIRSLDGHPLPIEQLPMARALSGEIFHDYRVLIRGVSGLNSVMSYSGSPAYAGDGAIEGAVVIFRDITAHQKLERAKDEFLAVAAHELRSPLAAVRSYAELLLRREQQRDDADDSDIKGLSILTQQVSHMLRMVDNLLDLSRLDAGQIDLQIQRVNLLPLIQQVLDQQRPLAKSCNLMLSADQTEFWAECDSLRVRQVLTNLVNNAIKYSPPDAPIIVRLEQMSYDGTIIDDVEIGDHQCEAVNTDRLNQAVLISVHDHGSGISSDQQARLFQRFYRVSPRRAEGLGLGLYLSRQFVLMHGGRIWVESIEGQGSKFYFTLPIEQ